MISAKKHRKLLSNLMTKDRIFCVFYSSNAKSVDNIFKNFHWHRIISLKLGIIIQGGLLLISMALTNSLLTEHNIFYP